MALLKKPISRRRFLQKGRTLPSFDCFSLTGKLFLFLLGRLPVARCRIAPKAAMAAVTKEE